MSEQPERTSPPPPVPVRVIGKTLTRMVARAPSTWPLMRRLVTGFFDRSADGWDERVRPDAPEHLAALAAAVARLEAPPAWALDLGTGTGAGALWLAREFPDARVTGLDISEAMIERAKAKVSDELSGRVESWSATPSGCPSRTAPWSWSLRSACRSSSTRWRACSPPGATWSSSAASG
jgi:Methyltransferase domain